jgi:hypothetical protein
MSARAMGTSKGLLTTDILNVPVIIHCSALTSMGMSREHRTHLILEVVLLVLFMGCPKKHLYAD